MFAARPGDDLWFASQAADHATDALGRPLGRCGEPGSRPSGPLLAD